MDDIKYYALPPELTDLLESYCLNNKIHIEINTSSNPIAENTDFIYNFTGLHGEYKSLHDSENADRELSDDEIAELDVYTGPEEIVGIGYDKTELYNLLIELSEKNSPENIDIKRIAYNKYKEDWKADNKISPSLESRKGEEYALYCLDCADLDDIPKPFEDWIAESGYNGKIYARYEDFLYNQFRNKAYMKMLLSPDEYLLYEKIV